MKGITTSWQLVAARGDSEVLKLQYARLHDRAPVLDATHARPVHPVTTPPLWNRLLWQSYQFACSIGAPSVSMPPVPLDRSSVSRTPTTGSIHSQSSGWARYPSSPFSLAPQVPCSNWVVAQAGHAPPTPWLTPHIARFLRFHRCTLR